MISRWCDFDDCPMHPDYTEKEVKTLNSDFNIGQYSYYVSSPSYSGGSAPTQAVANTVDYNRDNFITNIDNALTFNTDNISIPLECLVCEFMEKKNMKKTLVINKAKKLLQGE